MSNTEHSPGPWRTKGLMVYAETCIATVKYESDAHLIAAAPKLLDACKKAESAFVNRNDDEMLQAQCLCTAVIAEAKKEVQK